MCLQPEIIAIIVDFADLVHLWRLALLAKNYHVEASKRLTPLKKLREAPWKMTMKRMVHGIDSYIVHRDIDNTDCLNLAEACVKGALANVRELTLSGNAIGDAGCAALADAAGKGALANLKELHLYNNQIGDAGCAALADAAGKGALPNLQTLELSGPDGGRGGIGDAGLTALACAKGALANLTTLWLPHNQIGDEGMIKFSEALGKGALPALKVLLVDCEEHEQLKKACQARGIELI
jgi:Ran GTPase-activating protein (RanGAP) involved in mRNA processing and transport